MARVPFVSTADLERLLRCLRQPRVADIATRFRSAGLRRAWRALLAAIDVEHKWAQVDEDGRK